MSSPRSQRRRRVEIEEDEDADLLRDPQRTTPSESGKRARTNAYNASESPKPDISDADESQTPATNSNTNRRSLEAENDLAQGEFQTGAIIRVKLTNFVTYEAAEFFPGPNLNMVIGPNGTGKSSLVCAICLGLGWGAKHLGRAGDVGEFVKHNTTEAFIEIELQGQKDGSNHVIRVKIIKENNAREWWLNNKKTSMKAIQDLTKSLSIQIDNLCQFLPQDKVSEFAALTPVELLQQTQRAAAPEEMLDRHNELKKHRKEEKELELRNSTDKEELEKLETRQDGLRAEVRKLEERREIESKVAFLRKSRPFVEYRAARTAHVTWRERRIATQKRHKRLKDRLEPTLKHLRQKKSVSGQISRVRDQRKQALLVAEREADRCLNEISAKGEDIVNIQQKRDAEVQAEKHIKTELVKLERKLTDLRARLKDEPIQFDSVAFNERIRPKTVEDRKILTEIGELTQREKEMINTGKEKRAEVESLTQQLAEFDTQEGQLTNKLKKASLDTAKLWKWVQEHMEDFEKEVYGPPIVSCSLKDPRYANVVEACLSPMDFLAITAQTEADHGKLSEQCTLMKLSHFALRTSEDTLPHTLSLDDSDMKRFGLEGWAMNYLDGPQPVINMLCSLARLSTTAMSLHDINNQQYDLIVSDGRISSWVGGGTKYGVKRRREYRGAVSTVTQRVSPARYWTNQPAESGEKLETQQKLKRLITEFAEMKEEIKVVRDTRQKLNSDRVELQKEISDISEEKARLQKAAGEQKALPGKIEREEKALQDKIAERHSSQDEIRNTDRQHDAILLSKAKKALAYKEQVEKIRLRHDELLEAEVRLIEASSDVEALEERNSGITRQLEEADARVKDIEREAKEAKGQAQRALEVCQQIMQGEDEETTERLSNLDVNLTLDSLELDIASEESKLEFIHANNPNAINLYERFQRDVERLQDKIKEADERLRKLQIRITKVRSKWEPRLDDLIGTISEAFAYNFEQIGCAGEVSVEKTEDFEDWAILIKVKFRENEELQVLDKHRQSGGERSVSTIFYLMALQSLARSPFRVVDEINQGMDPRNERMVHERMVEIACKEHTSQYFLITPKLLTGLRYDERMKVLCIASGEYMPKDHTKLDVRKIISLRRAIVGAA